MYGVTDRAVDVARQQILEHEQVVVEVRGICCLLQVSNLSFFSIVQSGRRSVLSMKFVLVDR